MYDACRHLLTLTRTLLGVGITLTTVSQDGVSSICTLCPTAKDELGGNSLELFLVVLFFFIDMVL